MCTLDQWRPASVETKNASGLKGSLELAQAQVRQDRRVNSSQLGTVMSATTPQIVISQGCIGVLTYFG